MAGFDMDPDRWLSRTRNSDEDFAAHPLFGAHHHPASAAGPLFMDVGGHAFQHGAARQCSDDDFHERRAVNHLDMDDDGDEVLIARAISRRDEMTDSLSAAPAFPTIHGGGVNADPAVAVLTAALLAGELGQ
jgi:hypothetical protein